MSVPIDPNVPTGPPEPPVPGFTEPDTDQPDDAELPEQTPQDDPLDSDLSPGRGNGALGEPEPS
ncbi:hypothetical protein [Aquipseudomonas ullengensis]|uniref:Uncharacterized protein n=1 Tax=Aquipseudomonas ullengensis TaxID=2759166 RepID=A0A7W4LQI3_9GAMM|nr:hypothetical protein [Pseudomonas ullengensis]MBB2497500.1 hypothetical protein [Pseudomonas ullengensis]